jgi:hypothetical protein
MITILCDFRQFSAKKLAFFSKKKILSISKTLTFLFGQEKPDNQEKNSSIPVTLKIIIGRQTCRPAQTRATNLSA